MSNAGELRNEVLKAVQSAAKSYHHNLQALHVLGQFRSQFPSIEREQALLTIWQDLFRTGYLDWGQSLNSPDPPFFHLTEKGKKWLEYFSRDPVNPIGYLAYVTKEAKLNPIAQSYLEEALKSYNNDCIKSSVVMTGAAAESLAFELRDALVAKIDSLGQRVPSDLKDQRIKRVLEGLEKTIGAKANNMPLKLREAFEAHWPSFVHQIRQARNDAGHPQNIGSVSGETAQATLLIFPELARLYSELSVWITSSYS